MSATVPEDLLGAARAAIRANYDRGRLWHTVGAALRCADGTIVAGVNLFSVHGACAEVVALGTALTAGRRGVVEVVAVRGAEGEELLPPCGNCRQMLSDFAPECAAWIPDGQGGARRVLVADLLPGAYRVLGDDEGDW